MGTKLVKQVNFPKKAALLRYFQRKVSRTINRDKYSDVTVYNIQRLAGKGISSSGQSYLLELVSKRADGSLEFKKIVAKPIGSNHELYANLKLHEKHFLKIRSVRIPKIIHVDLESGYVFTEFLTGTNVENILHQIILQKHIKNWQKRLFEEIGQGLAEINLKLKIVHGDPITANWICEEGREKLSLIDWECAGKGDPAWDLSSLIYDVGRIISHLSYDSGLERQDGITDLFDAICLAIITGYAKVDGDKEIIRQSAGYWTHHVFSVIPKIHEKLFQHCHIPLPSGFRVLRWLPAPIFSTTIVKKQSVAKRLMKICTRIDHIILLILVKRNFELAKRRMHAALMHDILFNE